MFYACETREMRMLDNAINIPIFQMRNLRLSGEKCRGVLPSPHSWEVVGQEANTGFLRSQAPDSTATSGSLWQSHPIHSFIHSFFHQSIHPSEHPTSMDTAVINRFGSVASDNVNRTNSCLRTVVYYPSTRWTAGSQSTDLGKNELWGECV